MQVKGDKIKLIRTSSGLSQKGFAEYLGISPQHLNIIEKNKKGVSFELASKISDGLGVSIYDISDLKANYNFEKSFFNPTSGYTGNKAFDDALLKDEDFYLNYHVILEYQGYLERFLVEEHRDLFVKPMNDLVLLFKSNKKKEDVLSTKKGKEYANIIKDYSALIMRLLKQRRDPSYRKSVEALRKKITEASKL